ncbi:MAG: S-layer protein [Firmicutes bacterium]|nr:S-layer protein [Bacillota bacterium]
MKGEIVVKKQAVIFIVLMYILGLAATAFAAAANPFAEVPEKHWSYDAVKELVQAGLIDSYDYKVFTDRKSVTRYEFAIVVAKAIAKGDDAHKATIQKLEVEYANELTNLGVNVEGVAAKPVVAQISGDAFIKYVHTDKSSSGVKTLNNPIVTRARLYVNGTIDDQWTYTARIENNSTLNEVDGSSSEDSNGQNTVLNETYVTGKVFGGSYSLGRQGRHATVLDGLVYDGDFKGVLANYHFGAVEATTRYGVENVATTYFSSGKRNVYGSLELKSQVGQFNLGTAYHNYSVEGSDGRAIWEVTARTPVSPVVALSAGYARSNADSDNKAFTLKASYKNSDPSQVGSYGAWLQYRYTEANSLYVSTYDITSVNSGGAKGVELGAEYVPWKNVLWSTVYEPFKSINNSSDHNNLFYSRLWFFF